MTTLMRYDPLREVLSLRDAMNQLFEQSFVHPFDRFLSTPAVVAPLDVYETEKGYQVQVLLPGIKPEDIDLSVQQNTLTLKGQYPALYDQGKQVNWLIHEIASGSFERTITFDKPIDMDMIESNYENGVLTISLPFSEVSRPKRISITNDQPQKELVEAGAH